MLAYGENVAGALREHAPNLVYEPGERELPVDWRRCRQARCANAPDDPRSTRTWATPAAVRATAFTHVIRRDGRLYLQYWLYYPDSNTAVAGSDRVWERSWILPRIRELVVGQPRLPRLSPRRLGGRLRPHRSGREHLGSRQRARPLPGLQVAGVPKRVDPPDGLGARLARQPCRPRAVPRDAAAPQPARRARSPRASSRRRSGPRHTGPGCRSCPAGTSTSAPRAARACA